MRSLFKPEHADTGSETNRTTRVILIRHGRSTFNERKLYQGSSNASVLTEQGWQTAGQVGQYLKEQPIEAIYSSPLKRVRQTVEAILETMLETLPSTPDLHIHPGLREIDLHDWEGQSFQFVQETYAADYQCWKQRPHEFQLAADTITSLDASRRATAVAIQTRCFPVLDLYERAQQFWQDVLRHHPGQTIAVVGHGGTNRALISTALGLAAERFHCLQQSNCGISLLHFSDSCLAAGHLQTLNLTTPLGESLPKLKEGKQGLRLLLLPSESTSQSIEPLSARLREVAIEFSLASPDSTIADHLLQHHPATVQLQSQQEQFLLHWQRTIEAKSSDSPHLIAGLVVAKSNDIQHIIGEAIGLSPSQRWRLQVQPGALSVLHYPVVAHSPVLQAFNAA